MERITLREAREQRGLTALQLAASAGVTPYTVSLITGGRLLPSIAQARKLARALGVEPSEVVELAGAVGQGGDQR